VFCLLMACVISVGALLRVAYVLRDFYLGTASLAPGTEIRPMGVTLHLGLAWTASASLKLLDLLCPVQGGLLAHALFRLFRFFFFYALHPSRTE
jgi:hypothetical protein